MKNWLISLMMVLVCCIVGYIIVYYKADFDVFIDNNSFTKKELKSDEISLIVYSNDNFKGNNTSKRISNIEYIVIHYTGVNKDAESIIKSYNNGINRESSADFFVDYDGTIYQYNMDINNLFSWAVGGEKKDTLGGKYFGIVNNSNSLSIELCSKNNGNKEINSKDWKITDNTFNNVVLLTKYLMNEYSISSDNVIRHYDVTGKECPGVVGWNEDSGSVEQWELFKEKIS